MKKNINGSYETIKNFVRVNKDKMKQCASIRVESMIGKSAQIDWKGYLKLTNKYDELFIFNEIILQQKVLC